MKKSLEKSMKKAMKIFYCIFFLTFLVFWNTLLHTTQTNFKASSRHNRTLKFDIQPKDNITKKSWRKTTAPVIWHVPCIARYWNSVYSLKLIKKLNQLKHLNQFNPWTNSTLEPIQPLNKLNRWINLTLKPTKPLQQFIPWNNWILETNECLNKYKNLNQFKFHNN